MQDLLFSFVFLLGIVSVILLGGIFFFYFWYRYLTDYRLFSSILDSRILLSLLFSPLLILNTAGFWWLFNVQIMEMSGLLFSIAILLETPAFLYFLVRYRRLIFVKKLPDPQDMD